MKRCLPLAFACAFAFACAARADLIWEKTELELHPTPNDTKAVGSFKYENKGDKPVRFTSVHTSCGCTTAAHKDVVAPGEKGEITATFNIGDRTGVQTKTVTVQTDDPKQPMTTLTLKAVIAQPLELQPAFVFWQMGEEGKPKIITAKVSKDFAVKNLDVTSSNADFSTKVEHDEGDQFRIVVQPRDTTRSSSATLSIKADAAPGKTYYATARVTPAVVK